MTTSERQGLILKKGTNPSIGSGAHVTYINLESKERERERERRKQKRNANTELMQGTYKCTWPRREMENRANEPNFVGTEYFGGLDHPSTIESTKLTGSE